MLLIKTGLPCATEGLQCAQFAYRWGCHCTHTNTRTPTHTHTNTHTLCFAELPKPTSMQTHGLMRLLRVLQPFSSLLLLKATSKIDSRHAHANKQRFLEHTSLSERPEDTISDKTW